jgi:parallel beta-helix repeat protein
VGFPPCLYTPARVLERPGRLLGGACAVTLAFAGCADARTTTQARHGSACSRVASPGHSVESLVRSLRPGQTGCLRGGEYAQDVRVGNGGRPGARITLRSYPGERATIRGRLYVAPGGDFVTIAGLRLNSVGEDLPSPTVSGNHATFLRDEITNEHTGICLEVFGASFTTIRSSRIHDCGRLPATNHDHGIYVEEGYHTRILHNRIYDNADRGIQLYPRAYDTTITGNVIDGNGEGVLFSGGSQAASSRNRVTRNVIANSRIRYNVESFYDPGNPVGAGNVVTRNCLFGGPGHALPGGISRAVVGFSAFRNVVARPRYRNRARRDFRLRDGRCRSVFKGG